MNNQSVKSRNAKSVFPANFSYELNTNGISSLALLWIFRIVAQGFDFDPNEWARISHLHMLFKTKNYKSSHEALYRRLDKMKSDAILTLKELEPEFLKQSENSILEANLTKIKACLGLSSLDTDILRFAIHIQSDYILKEFIQSLDINSNASLPRFVSHILGITYKEAKISLSNFGRLKRSGLFDLSHDIGNLVDYLDLPEGLLDGIKEENFSPINTLKGYIKIGQNGTLTCDDYPTLTGFIANATKYLEISRANQRCGVNILLYGPPGSGKTELAKLLANRIGSELLEVSSNTPDQSPIIGATRFRHYWLAQNILGNSQSLVLFDEIEDVFDTHPGSRRVESLSNRKGWVNEVLETNPVPTIWITNEICQLDPAYIRRFDMICEVSYPSYKQRQRMLQSGYSDILSPPMIQKLAKVDMLAPAVISRAAIVARSITVPGDIPQAESNFESILIETLKAQGHGDIGRLDASQPVGFYDPSMVNSDCALDTLADGLCKTKSGRVCLFGPPGTGKTAFARWLADRIGIPLYAKRASDLISPWVGETEQNIARAFKAASDDGALLLIDEVDSFLQDRRSAQRGWEVSQVNELLIQMELFNGLFIASTNLMESLDQAALRRFDLKIKFGFLKPDQAESLFTRHLESAGLPPPEPAHRVRIRSMDRLTPGDFAAVVRQNRFRPLAGPEALLSGLEVETSLKEGAKGTIGFIR